MFGPRPARIMQEVVTQLRVLIEPDSRGGGETDGELERLGGELVALWLQPFLSLIKARHSQKWFRDSLPDLLVELCLLLWQSAGIQSEHKTLEVKLAELAHLLVCYCLSPLFFRHSAAELIKGVYFQEERNFNYISVRLARAFFLGSFVADQQVLMYTYRVGIKFKQSKSPTSAKKLKKAYSLPTNSKNNWKPTQ